MRLLVIYHGGATSQTRRLYRALAEAHGVDELTVVVPAAVRTERIYDPSGWLRAEPDDGDGYRLVPIALQDPTQYGLGFETAPLRRTLKETNADVVHVLDEPFSGYLLQVVRLARLHSRRSRLLFYGFDNRPIRFGRKGRLLWKVAWSQMAGGAGANSECLENVRLAGFPARLPLERIFWGVPTDLFEGAGADRAKIGLECERLIGFVGRLVPEKGAFVILSAMLSLPDSVHCVLVGNGPLRSELELIASASRLAGRVHFREPMTVEQLAPLMGSLDALVLPSLTTPRWKEQYGRVLGEAMAAGVPVVGSDSGAIPEVIGRAGLVVPEGEPIALAQACERVLFDAELAERLREEGRERAKRELSIPAMCDGLGGLYRRVLGDA